jgi:hypothetical protein
VFQVCALPFPLLFYRLNCWCLDGAPIDNVAAALLAFNILQASSVVVCRRLSETEFTRTSHLYLELPEQAQAHAKAQAQAQAQAQALK